MIGENDNINLEVHDKKKTILGLYGLFYVMLLVIIIVIGYSYLGKLEYFSRGNLTPSSLVKDSTVLTADLPIIKGTISAPVDLAKEVVSTPEKIAKGKTLFDANCVSCHGSEGKGDGTAGKTLNPPPRNFHDLNGWTNGTLFSGMYKTLHEGITARGMASYNNLKPEERIDMILYIRTFLPNYPAIDQKEVAAVDAAYSLTKGFKLPNQIPVKMAEEKLLDEKKEIAAKIENIVNTIANDKNDKGADIFRKISFDLKRSVTSMAGNMKWNENENAFVKFVTLHPVSKGFNASLNLTSEEWSAVLQYAKNIFSK
ncbi:MAG: cytochrome c [Candidatus Kapaibacterium sp.]